MFIVSHRVTSFAVGTLLTRSVSIDDVVVPEYSSSSSSSSSVKSRDDEDEDEDALTRCIVHTLMLLDVYQSSRQRHVDDFLHDQIYSVVQCIYNQKSVQ